MVNGEPINKPKNLFAFNAQGQFLWRVESNYAVSNYISDLVVDEDENIYVSALANGTKPNEPIYESFAGFTPYIDANCFTSSLSFIVKLNEQGIGLFGKNPQFENTSIKKRISLSGNELLLGISILNLKWGNQNFVGTNYYGAGIVRLNKDNGALIHIEQIPNSPTQGSYNTSITSDQLGNYYIGGGITDSVTVGPNSLVSSGGNTDFIIAKFGTDNCNCQVPTCRFAEAGLPNNSVQFTYQGQDVYDSVTWNFGDMTPTSSVANPLHTYTAPGIYNVCVTAINSCDTFQFCKLVDTAALSTSSFVEDFSVNMEISPNPARNFANITFSTAIINPTFEIYDIAGRLVQHYEPSVLNGKISLPISNMQTGMYVVILKQDGVMKMQKKLLVE
jgi:PKD repeat protein